MDIFIKYFLNIMTIFNMYDIFRTYSERTCDESETSSIRFGSSLHHLLVGKHDLGFHKLFDSVRRNPNHLFVFQRRRFHIL